MSILYIVKTEDYAEYIVHTQHEMVMKDNTAVFTCSIKPAFVKPFVNVISWYINDKRVTNGMSLSYTSADLWLTRWRLIWASFKASK